MITRRSPLPRAGLPAVRERRGVSVRLVPWAAAAALILLPAVARGQMSPGALSEAHADLDGTLRCLKCHGVGSSELADRCLECHTAIAQQVREKRGLHGRQAGKSCESCHPEHAGRDADLITWEGGAPEKFDHQRAGWPLEGRHARIACRECHKPGFQDEALRGLLKRKDPSTSWLGLLPECRICHQDPHQGALQPDCQRCHGMEAWRPAEQFDHQRTAYPLAGEHAQVECAKCHLTESVHLRGDQGRSLPRYRPVPHGECSVCHADPHKGQLGADCSKCHVTEGFKLVDPKAFDHSRTRYPLRGRHVSVKCEACHDPVRAWGKKPRFDACGSCHRDPHAGKATLAGKAVDCAACHGVEGFRPATYTAADHDRAAFALAGKHRAVECRKCHLAKPPGVPREVLGTAGVLMRPAHKACLDCHANAHAKQFADRAGAGACESCHVVDGWKPSTFTAEQHAELDFGLQGRHGEVECRACHGPQREGLPALPGPEELGTARVSLAGLSGDCRSCHFDPHEGLFSPGGARAKPSGCEGCHDLRSFRPARVDVASHAEYRFPLEGAHGAVPCIGCHPELRQEPSRVRLLEDPGEARRLHFAEEHDRCAVCHDTPHGDQFSSRDDGGACDTCHDVNAFRPASRFDHARHTSYPLEGAHRTVACGACHASRQDPEGRPQVVYRPTPRRCQDCHRRPVPALVESAPDSEGKS